MKYLPFNVSTSKEVEKFSCRIFGWLGDDGFCDFYEFVQIHVKCMKAEI